jgi:hypothetical protein
MLRRILLTWMILWVMTEIIPFPSVLGFTVPSPTLACSSLMKNSQRTWRMRLKAPTYDAVVSKTFRKLRLLPQRLDSLFHLIPCTLLLAAGAGGGGNIDNQDDTAAKSTIRPLDELDRQALEEMEQEQPSEWMVMKQVRLQL